MPQLNSQWFEIYIDFTFSVFLELCALKSVFGSFHNFRPAFRPTKPVHPPTCTNRSFIWGYSMWCARPARTTSGQAGCPARVRATQTGAGQARPPTREAVHQKLCVVCMQIGFWVFPSSRQPRALARTLLARTQSPAVPTPVHLLGCTPCHSL